MGNSIKTGMIVALIVLPVLVLSWPGSRVHAAEEEGGETLDLLLSLGLEQLSELEVTLATGTSRPVNLAPAVATVITATEIERIGATTLDQILETVPGLHVLPSALNLFTSNYSIRGINTKMNPHVLLLINGTPLTRNYSGGRPQTFRMPVSMISRVEVFGVRCRLYMGPMPSAG